MSASKHSSEQQSFRVGLVLGGGGPLGGIYTIGALRALDEAFEGLEFNNLNVYVGVSAGAFLAANLANQVTTVQMCRVFVKNEYTEHPFLPEMFIKPAFSEYAKRFAQVPVRAVEVIKSFLRNRTDQTLLEALTTLGQALPAGIFDNAAVDTYLEKLYNLHGRTNDFRKLHRKLYLIAADLDTSEAVRFGATGYDHVPISRAVQASVASPGLYLPVEIDGRHYVDGALRKTLHATIAFEEGSDLVIAINPLVPLDTNQAIQSGSMKPGERIVDGGFPNVLSQTSRSVNHSRMVAGIEKCQQLYPKTDFILMEPSRDDSTMFFANVYSFEARRTVCEHAYQMTRLNLLQREKELQPMLKKYGIKMRKDILEDEQRTFSSSLYGNVLPFDQRSDRGKKSLVVQRLGSALDELDQLLGSKP